MPSQIKIQKKIRVLICRTDNIGDVILTLPITTALKNHYPEAAIFFLARSYTQPIVEAYQSVDQFIDWEKLEAKTDDEITHFLKELKLDAVIHNFPVKRILQCTFKARIPIRTGKTGKLCRWIFYYNKLITNARYDGQKSHEAQVALKFLKVFNIKSYYKLSEIIELNQLKFPTNTPEIVSHSLSQDKFNLVVHPGSHGHGKEWPLSSFQTLLSILPEDKFHIILTGSATEDERLGKALMQHCPSVTNTMGKLKLSELAFLLRKANAVLASGTGPLHLAASLGTQTLGLYPNNHCFAGPTRWGPLGKRAEYLTAKTSCESCQNKRHEECSCMLNLDPETVKNKLMDYLKEI